MKPWMINLLCLLGFHNWKLCFKENGQDVMSCTHCKWTLGGGYRDDVEKVN